MTFYVGIDIAKYSHVACLIDQFGRVLIEPFSFDNNSVGFNMLISKLDSFSNDTLRFGFESTAHYRENLAHFLSSSSFSYELINPLLSKRFRSLNIRDVKNDNIDALTIASFLAFNHNHFLQDEFFINELAFLAKERNNLIKQRAREYTRLTAYLDRVFPKLKTFIGASIKSLAFHNLLKKYSTAKEIKETRIDALYNSLNFKRKFRSLDQVKEIKELAKCSVGYHSDTLSKVIKNIIHQIEFLSSQIDAIESEIKSHNLVIDFRLNQIPGMGPIQIAYILSAIRNISYFDEPSKILAYAGLDPKIRQSGNFSARSTRMSKRGNNLLRYALTWSAHNVIKNSSTMETYYLKKRAEGKSHYNALGHCAKKVVNYIFYILNNPDKKFVLK
ncbi:IS110 family transposase [Erysipelotrichaceae bacterium OttesenSCG-928-M19]|nr:IS110 family transposase [Erysipelotrichaceae bacterium OttesenSCG-928-M19]